MAPCASAQSALRFATWVKTAAQSRMREGFVDTGDALELRGDRYYFVGRRDGIINVGGLKVHPEEVEAVINRHPRVRMSLVRTRKNPITGALVVADVVLNTGPTTRTRTTGRRAGHPAVLPRGTCPLTRSRPRSISCLHWRSRRLESSSVTMRNVIVTGGSRGLGLGIACRLAESGFRAIAIARKESD